MLKIVGSIHRRGARERAYQQDGMLAATWAG